MSQKEAILDAEGRIFPGKSYMEAVLSPAYDNATKYLLSPMLSVHKAHLIMLKENSLISETTALQITSALREINTAAYRNSTYTGEFEDLFFAIEKSILESVGDIGGNLHLARSRNDMGVAMYRLTLRTQILELLRSIIRMRTILLEVSAQHADTIMLGYTHTQQAQPMTFAHYLLAMHDSLSRDYTRLFAAYQNCNKSPLGAAALTTSGFQIDRYRVAELLGFDGLVENSYDAIGGADYLGQVASSLQLLFIGMGRYTQDFLLWSTQEFDGIQVADPYVQVSSIMPQKRNPVSLEHIRALSSSGVGNSATVLQMLHNTPFGDIVDTEDDLLPYLWRSLALAQQLFDLFSSVIGTLQVNKELLFERTRKSYATVTEFADTLVRERKLGFRTAHTIASAVAQRALSKGLEIQEISSAFVDDVSQDILGTKLHIKSNVIKQCFDPTHFVKIRDNIGGPAPTEVKRMISERERDVNDKVTLLDSLSAHLDNCNAQLDEIPNAWSRVK